MNIIVHLETCLWPPDKHKFNIHFLFSSVLVSTKSCDIWLLSCYMLHYVHLLVDKRVSFGVGEVADIGFIRACLLIATATGNKFTGRLELRVNQNSEVASRRN